VGAGKEGLGWPVAMLALPSTAWVWAEERASLDPLGLALGFPKAEGMGCCRIGRPASLASAQCYALPRVPPVASSRRLVWVLGA